jgi:hypothetical protein
MNRRRSTATSVKETTKMTSSHPSTDAARRPALLLVLAGVAVLLLTPAAQPTLATAPPADYSFELLATMPQAAPGIPGKYLARDFELGGFNDSGSAFWATDFNAVAAQPPWAAAEGEALWMTRHGGAPELVAASGGLDPEGVTFSNGFPGPVSLNDAGDGAFAFRLLPAPGSGASTVLNAGLYRYDHANGQVTTIAKSCRPPYSGCGPFAGFNFGVHINGRGDVVFHGVTKTSAGTYPNPEDGGALYGVGIYQADAQNNIAPIVVPGDPAPSGGLFNNLRNAWQNDRGDIAFGGHTDAAGEVACATLSCAESIYLRHADDGTIESIAHRGEVAPVPGGLKYDYAFGPRVNNRGELVFVGCLTPTVVAAISCGTSRGVFHYHDGAVEAVAYPGQAFMAEGDSYTAIRAANIVNNYYVNDAGTVVFTLQYDADVNGDGIKDSGVFTKANGEYEVVAKTGDVIPGVGTVAHMSQPVNVAATSSPQGYSLINNRGTVLFQATLSDGTGALLVAKP